jgi:hypothetical protein
MQKIWEYIKAFFGRIFKLCVRYPLASAATVLLIIGAVVMLATGRTIQIGGLLGKLWGTKPSINPDVRVLPPPNRVDPSGQPILPGQPDQQGYVQAPATVEIKPPGILSNPDTITIVHPTQGEVVLPLPTGVTNMDVAQVVMIDETTYQVHNNDTGVKPDEVLDILNKP